MKQDKNTKIIPSLKICCEILESKKAENIKILYVGPQSTITDYFVIATATSVPQIKAIKGELEKSLKDNDVFTLGSDYHSESGWMVIDGFHFMVHVFLPKQRSYYALDALWKDGQEVCIQDLE